MIPANASNLNRNAGNYHTNTVSHYAIAYISPKLLTGKKRWKSRSHNFRKKQRPQLKSDQLVAANAAIALYKYTKA